MINLQYSANVGDTIWFIENNSVLKGIITQVIISINIQNTKIEYILNNNDESYIRPDSEIHTSIIDALLELSERYEI